MNSGKKSSNKQKNVFFTDFINNKFVLVLFNILLILLIILVFTRIAYLFVPVLTFINLVAFPVIGAGILYYLLYPLVNYLTAKGLSKNLAIWVIFLVLAVLIGWGISTLVPMLQEQSLAFIADIPRYQRQFSHLMDYLPEDIRRAIFTSDVTAFFETIDWKNITDQMNTIITTTFGGLGSVIGTVAQVVTGLVTMPVVLYYLLLEGDNLPEKILDHVPTKYRHKVKTIFFQSNYQISQYIRGQIIVAMAVGIVFAIGYSIIGLDYAIVLAAIAAVLNIIPYLGSIIAVIPALVIALLISPYMLVKTIIVIVIEQTIEGRFISPQILGNNLKIHPVTILFVLLGAGRVMGITGVILGVPGYAVIKVIVTELYKSLRESSDLYESAETMSEDEGITNETK